MCDCPMMEKLARIARERDDLKAQNRRLIEQKQALINRIMNMKLQAERPSASVRAVEKAHITCDWTKESV